MPKQPDNSTGRDVLSCLVLALITVAVSLVFSLYGADPHHDGIMFEAALKVSRGGLLFRDTFIQYGALAVYYDALFIKLLGESMASIQVAASVALGGCAVLVYTITKRVTGRSLAFVTALMVTGLNYIYFWHSHPWSSLPAMFCQLLACDLMMQEHKDGKSWKLLLAGVSAAVGTWCRLPVGLLTFLAGVVGLVLVQVICREKASCFAKKLLWYGAGYLIMLAVFMAQIVLSGTYDAWYNLVIANSAEFVADSNTAGASRGFLMRLGWSLLGAWILRNPLFDWLWLALPACMGLTLLAIGWPVIRAYIRDPLHPAVPQCTLDQRMMVIVSAFACGGWAQYYPVACYRHWYWSAVPMLPILAYDLWALTGRRRLAKPWLPAALLAALLAGNLLLRGYFALASLGAFHYERDLSETRPGITSFFMDENWNRNDTEVYFNENYPYLNGLRLAPDTAAFYDELHTVLDELKARYPEKNIYSRAGDGYWGVYQGEYIPYGDAAFKDYTQVENEYIAAHKPIILANGETGWKGWTEEYKTYAVIKGNDGRVNNATLYIMVAE